MLHGVSVELIYLVELKFCILWPIPTHFSLP